MHGISAVRQDFEPPDIRGCCVWLRADRGVRYSGISPPQVTQWENQVAGIAGGDASQGTGANQPTRVIGANGMAALRFASVNAQRLAWTPVLTGAKTIVVVAKLTSEPHSGFTVYTYGAAAATVSEMILDLATYQYVSFVDNGIPGAMLGFNDTMGTTAPHALIHTVTSGLSYTGNYDGADRSINTSGAYGFVLTPGSIGARPDGTFPMDGDIYEIIFYNTVLLTADIQRLWGYLKARYAISS